MLIGIGLFLLLLVLLLAVPVTLKFEVSLPLNSKNQMVVRWFFGLVIIRLPLKPEVKPESNKKVDEKPKKATKTGSGKGFKKVFKLLTQKDFRDRLLGYLNSVWRAISKQDMSLHITAGLGDPAETGKLWGAVGPLAANLVHVHQLPIHIEPVFMQARFDVDGQATFRLMPLWIILLSLRLFFSPVLWRGLRQIRQGDGA